MASCMGDNIIRYSPQHTGVQVLRLRKDGFVAVHAPYVFRVPRASLPALVTLDFELPADCPRARDEALLVNTTCGAAEDMVQYTQGYFGCGYRFPGQQCPWQCPAKPCGADSDCAVTQPDPTQPSGCRGPPMKCMHGQCSNGAAGGQPPSEL